ncbi:MAG: hypothetical protein IKQ10_01455 [Oscillospiraceae bacterium]|nr:hypothetical protein [Oscillospiraceae bacterium]
MARNKYVRDYRLLESIDERGRIQVASEYIGRYYEFAADAGTVAAEKKRLLALCAAAWAAFVGAMLPISGAMRTFYVSLPYVFSALPLGMLTALALAIPADGRLMEHRTADRIENSLPPRALFTALLPGAALLAQLARLLVTRTGLWPGDAVFCLGAAAVSALGAAAFSRRKKLAVRATDARP